MNNGTPPNHSLPSVPDYAMVHPIGRGAFGEVWLARGVTGQFRAVKILYRSAPGDSRNFEREFEGLQRYEPVSRTQANLVHILHIGRAPEGDRFWYVMELADAATPPNGGEAQVLAEEATGSAALTVAAFHSYAPRTLRSDLRQRGRLPVNECVRIALGLAGAVAYLHEQGLVHRDIKPSNVIFVQGAPKLADVGLVAMTDEQTSLVGTAGYIPPDGTGTPAADVYALGKVFYEMASGRPLADFPKLPADFDVMTDRAELLEFNEVIVRAADPDPRRRYATVAELRSDLLLLAAGRGVTRWHGLERRVRYAIRLGVVLLVVALVMAGFGLWANHLRRRAETAERELSQRYLAQQIALARATRLTGRPGQRYRTLELVREAAKYTNTSELRSEAIAAMALPDVRPWRTILSGKTNLWMDGTMQYYATNDDAGNIYVRSLVDDRLMAAFPAHGTLLESHFSPDGNSLAATYSANECRVWHFQARTFDAPVVFPFPPTADAWLWLPDGNTLAFDDTNGALHLFDARDGSQSRVLTGATHKMGEAHISSAAGTTDSFPTPLPFRIRQIAFSPDGGHLAAWDSTNLAVYSMTTGEELNRWRVPGPPFNDATWHPDGRRLLILGQAERMVRIWDWESGDTPLGLIGHQSQVPAAAFDAAGQWLATVSWDNQTFLWNLMEGRPMLKIPESGNGGPFDPEGRRIAWSAWKGGTARLFELPATHECQRLDAREAVWAVQPLGCVDLVASVNSDGFGIWQAPFSWSLAQVKVDIGHQVAAAADGGLWTSGNAGLAHWSANLDPQRHEVRFGPPHRESPELMPVDFFAVARQDRRLLAHSPGRGVWLRPDLASTNWIQLTNAGVFFLAMDPDGRFAAAAIPGSGIAIWNGEDGSAVTFIPLPQVRRCGFSPDGNWLMAMGVDEFAAWQVSSWRAATRWPRDPSVALAFTISASGRAVALADNPGELRLVEIGTWRELARLPSLPLSHEPAFGPDGVKLAVPSEGAGVELWDFRAIRAHLALLGCDWDAPPFPPASSRPATKAWRVIIDPGLKAQPHPD